MIKTNISWKAKSMRDFIETFKFIKKYHQDLDATLRGMRESKRIHELTESDRRAWISSYGFAMIVLRDIGQFMLGKEQPQDFDPNDDPFDPDDRQTNFSLAPLPVEPPPEEPLRPSLLDPAEAQTAAEDAVERATYLTGVGRKIALLQAVRKVAEQNEYFTTDQVWDLLGEVGDDYELGPIMRLAFACGLMEPTGQSKRSERPPMR